jgi:hypothetical protein
MRAEYVFTWEVGKLFNLFEYFMGARLYFVIESIVVMTLLVTVMVMFGKMVQGKEKPRFWSSPQPASKIYALAASGIWATGASLVIQSSKLWVIIGICLVVGALMLAFHTDLMLMGVWYLASTGRPMLGLGRAASMNKHKQHLESAKNRGKLCLEKAKHPASIWTDKPIKL